MLAQEFSSNKEFAKSAAEKYILNQQMNIQTFKKLRTKPRPKPSDKKRFSFQNIHEFVGRPIYSNIMLTLLGSPKDKRTCSEEPKRPILKSNHLL